MKRKFLALFLCFTLLVSASGCATLAPEEYEQYGYHGEPVVKEGARILPLDWLGNLFGIFYKLILFHWKVKRHNIQEDTEKAVTDYLATRGDRLGNVAVQLNRYAPQDAWRRLFQNRGVKWPYRYTFGILTVLIVDTLLINRIFGFDYYNPFTHTVNLHSDLPSIALHELGHAKDFSGRCYRGSYAIFRLVPFVDLYQEDKATDYAFEYVRAEKLLRTEIESYKILYPAYGTYAGSYLGSPILGAIVGHIWGRSEARPLEKRLRESE